MPRPTLALNSWGKITCVEVFETRVLVDDQGNPVLNAKGKKQHVPVLNEKGEKKLLYWNARTRYRGTSGATRQVKAKGATKGKASRNLEDRLRSASKVRHQGDLNAATTVSVLADVWLKDREGDVRKSTYKGYESIVKTHIKPRMGGLRLGEVTTGRLEDVMSDIVAEISDDGEGRSTPTRVRRCLSGMFTMAVRLDVMPHHPVTHMKPLPKLRKAHPRMTPGDLLAIRSLLAEAENPLVRDDTGEIVVRGTGTLHGSRPAPGTPIKRSGPTVRNSWVDLLDLMLGTGMRIGEALAVRLYEDTTYVKGSEKAEQGHTPEPDIDLKSEVRTVTVSGTIIDAPADRQPFPKTEAGHRVLVLPGWVESMIMKRDHTMSGPNPQGLLFVTRTGTPVTPSNQRRLFRKALKGTLYEGVTPHDIRSVVATAVEAAVDIKTASKVLGHSSEAVTQGYLAKAHQAPDVTGVLEQFNPSRDLNEVTVTGTV